MFSLITSGGAVNRSRLWLLRNRRIVLSPSFKEMSHSPSIFREWFWQTTLKTPCWQPTSRFKWCRRKARLGMVNEIPFGGREDSDSIGESDDESGQYSKIERMWSVSPVVLLPAALTMHAIGIVQGILGQMAMAAQYQIYIVLQAGGGGDGVGTIDDIANALCELGLGSLATLILYVGSLYLIFKGCGYLYKGFAKGRSRDSGTRSESGGEFVSGGTMLLGSIVVGGLPIILNAVGFTLISCINPVNPLA